MSGKDSERSWLRNLRNLREKSGWSRARLAARVGIHANTILNYENEQEPKEIYVQAIAQVLGVREEDLDRNPNTEVPAEMEWDGLEQLLSAWIKNAAWIQAYAHLLEPENLIRVGQLVGQLQLTHKIGTYQTISNKIELTRTHLLCLSCIKEVLDRWGEYLGSWAGVNPWNQRLSTDAQKAFKHLNDLAQSEVETREYDKIKKEQMSLMPVETEVTSHSLQPADQKPVAYAEVVAEPQPVYQSLPIDEGTREVVQDQDIMVPFLTEVQIGSVANFTNFDQFHHVPIYFPQGWLQKQFSIRDERSSMVLISVSTPFMVPTIAQGDVALVDREQTSLTSDGVFLIEPVQTHRLSLFRIKQDPLTGEIQLTEDHHPESVRTVQEEDLNLVGKVLGAFRKI